MFNIIPYPGYHHHMGVGFGFGRGPKTKSSTQCTSSWSPAMGKVSGIFIPLVVDGKCVIDRVCVCQILPRTRGGGVNDKPWF